MSMSSFLNQVKAHPFSTFFIVLGQSISILLLSTGISSLLNMNMILQQQLQYAPQNSIRLDIEFTSDHTINEIMTMFNEVSDTTGIMLDRIDIFSTYARYIVEYWPNQIIQRYPLESGRYFKKSELMNGEKIALVGKSILDHLTIENGEKYIDIEYEKYRVIGVIGIEGKKNSTIDNLILIPALSLPKNTLDKIYSKKSISIILHNLYQDTFNDAVKMKKNIESKLESTKVFINQGNTLSIHVPRFGNELYISFFIYVLAMINTINLTSYWINERRYEIGIKKAFGYSNYDITKELFTEMCILSTISVLSGFTMQVIFKSILERFIDYPLVFSYTTFFAAILFVIISAILTTAIPSIKAMKVQPIESINE